MAEDGSSSTESVAASPRGRDALPPYLRVLPDFGVVLCTTHGSCYTRQTLSRHLLEKHRLRIRQRRAIECCGQFGSVAASIAGVVQPQDGTDEIHGLPTVLGFLCHLEDCNFRSTSADRMRQHYNREHRWHVASQGSMPWHQAFLQTLFHQK